MQNIHMENKVRGENMDITQDTAQLKLLISEMQENILNLSKQKEKRPILKGEIEKISPTKALAEEGLLKIVCIHSSHLNIQNKLETFKESILNDAAENEIKNVELQGLLYQKLNLVSKIDTMKTQSIPNSQQVYI